MNLYYVDLNKSLGEDFSEYEFSKHGIPLLRSNRTEEWKHNPVTVCQYALNQFNLFIRSGLSDPKQKFLAQADWLMHNYEKGENECLLPTTKLREFLINFIENRLHFRRRHQKKSSKRVYYTPPFK